MTKREVFNIFVYNFEVGINVIVNLCFLDNSDLIACTIIEKDRYPWLLFSTYCTCEF